jgi:hypothetical protein
MGWLQRRRERVAAQRARYCVGQLAPSEDATDVHHSMFYGPRGWAEGDLLLTSQRVVFRPRKGLQNWSITMRHESIVRIEEVDRNRYGPVSSVYLIQLQDASRGLLDPANRVWRIHQCGVTEFRIDTSRSFMAVWTSVLDLG